MQLSISEFRKGKHYSLCLDLKVHEGGRCVFSNTSISVTLLRTSVLTGKVQQVPTFDRYLESLEFRRNEFSNQYTGFRVTACFITRFVPAVFSSSSSNFSCSQTFRHRRPCWMLRARGQAAVASLSLSQRSRCTHLHLHCKSNQLLETGIRAKLAAESEH